MIDKNYEGWFRPIHKYPLGWSRLAAGSVRRLLFMLFMHVLFAAMFWWSAPEGQFDFTIIIFTAFLPGLYLYAIFRLVKIIESGNIGERHNQN